MKITITCISAGYCNADAAHYRAKWSDGVYHYHINLINGGRDLPRSEQGWCGDRVIHRNGFGDQLGHRTFKLDAKKNRPIIDAVVEIMKDRSIFEEAWQVKRDEETAKDEAVRKVKSEKCARRFVRK